MKLEFHVKNTKDSVVQCSYNILKEIVNNERGLELNLILDDILLERKYLEWVDFRDSL